MTPTQRGGANAAPAVDRYLCAFAHESPGFAGYVLGELVAPSVRAPSPACGVDLVALVRHATAATRARGRATGLLAAAPVLVVAGVLGGACSGHAPAGLGLAVLALAAAFLRTASGPRPDARTYLCAEKTSWGGELVVNLFVRAAMVHNDLFLECHAYVLLPLRAELTGVDSAPLGGLRIAGRVLAATLRETPRRLLDAPRALLGDLSRKAARGREQARARREVQRGQPVDRGAGLSIRAFAAAPERAFLFAYTDEEMHLNALQRRVLETIRDFLDRHGVDSEEFQRQRTNIVTNYTIGTVQAQSAAFGNQNTIVQGGPGAPAGAAPAGPAPPWAP